MEAYINIRLINQFAKKKYKTIFRYPLDTLSMVIRPLITIIPYLIFIMAKPSYSLDIDIYSIIYILIAYFFAMNISDMIISYNRDLLNELQQGTYGILQLSPIPYLNLLYNSVISNIMVNLMIGNTLVILFITMGVVELNIFNIIIFEYTYIATSIIAFSISIVLSYFTYKFEEIRITYLINSILLFLAGITYPIDIYPVWLKKLALFSPITIGLEVIKDILSGRDSIDKRYTLILSLTIFLIVLTYISRKLFYILLNSLKQNGKIKI